MANVDLGNRYKRLVQFFWDPEPRNDDPNASPIWCLGREYKATTKPLEKPTTGDRPISSGNASHELDRETVLLPSKSPESQPSCNPDGGVMTASTSSEEERGWPGPFLDDIESRFWFTYRSHFPPISRPKNSDSSSSLTLAVRLRSQIVDSGGFTSDTGFGCMIRSGQCLVANAIAMLKLGRDWKRRSREIEEKELLSWFADDPKAPFSVHRFIDHGASACGKQPGEWFGPSATAQCIQALCQQHESCGLKVYVTGDGADVYEDVLFNLAKQDGKEFTPVLILVGIRLGIDRVNPVYWEALKKSLQLPESIGVAGGRPSASHYFVGTQGDNFFYLDPHQTRPMLPYHEDSSAYIPEDVDSCHTRRLRRLHIEKMDPSMLIAFLIRDKDSWRDWRNSMSQVQGKPVLHISDKSPQLHDPSGAERDGAVDEVESFDDEGHDDEDGELINLPPF